MTKISKTTKVSSNPVVRVSHRYEDVGVLHPAWVAFIQYCQELCYGEISQLKVQDGIPVMAEQATKKIKFI